MFETINKWSFKKRVFNSQDLTLLNFWVPWSIECQSMSRLMVEVGADFGIQEQILQMNWEAHRDLAEDLEVYGVPTLLIFHHGKLVKRYSGLLTRNELTMIIDQMVMSC